jgi:D-3-phosphoglycerate dehydrogenase / 2-oxoglutarate reductase
MPAKALILAPFDDGYLSRLRAASVRATYEPWTASGKLQNPSALAARLRDEEIGIIVVEADYLTAEAFAAPKLRLAAVCRNGLNLVDVNAATERGIPIIYTPTRNTIAVAEHAIALMLSIARQSYTARDYVVAGEWTNPMDAYARFQGREVNGSTVGVIGLGNIGGEVAKRVQALGAQALGYDPFVSKERARALGVRLAKLPALLRKVDFVTLHTSLSSKERVLDTAALDMMKPSAYVINTGAQQALDYDALAERLRDGRLAGAALDVFPGFVLAPDSPLRGLDNVIVTPHIGGATTETVVRQSRTVFEDVQRYLRGARPRNVANPEAFKAAARGR